MQSIERTQICRIGFLDQQRPNLASSVTCRSNECKLWGVVSDLCGEEVIYYDIFPLVFLKNLEQEGSLVINFQVFKHKV
jgi:hypothetical protein